jgi:hypothetical protein
MLRTSLLAAAALAGIAAAPALAQTSAERCGAADFRIYFAHGSATLDRDARAMLAAAERQVADCDYAELRVAVSGSRAQERAAAIRAAADSRSWDAVRVMRSELNHEASYGPEFAQVTLSPERGEDGAPLTEDVGV